MRVFDDLRERLRTSLRAFVLGSAVVSPTDRTFGVPPETFSPEKYGEYIAISNAVYACVTQRAYLLSMLPLRLYKNTSGGRNLVETGSLFELLKSVNPRWSFKRLIRMSENALCLWGRSFWFLERPTLGPRPKTLDELRRVRFTAPPREMWWGRPDRVKIFPHETEYLSGFTYQSKHGAMEQPYAPGEVIWLQYDNPLDEFSGLSPIAAARLSADYEQAALLSNRNLFLNGIQAGGFIVPDDSNGLRRELTPEQAREIETLVERRFQGVDKAHKWSVFRFAAKMMQASFNPKEAEFLGGQALALENIARAYRWPLDLIGGRRTYENVDAAMVAAFQFCILPEAQFIAEELNEQLLPMFPGQADECQFDSSMVEVLQEDRAEIIDQMRKLWDMGVPLNALLNQFMPQLLPPEGAYKWGDAWWAPLTVAPIRDGAKPAAEEESEDAPAETEERAMTKTRTVEFGSEEHERLWQRAERRLTKHQTLVQRMVAALLERQRSSVINRLKHAETAERTAEQAADEPFDKAQWIKNFRTEARPIFRQVVADAGSDALDDLGLTLSFDVTRPAVARFVEQRAQRFAVRVNETTWEELRQSLAEGLEAGEGLPKLIERVESIMAERIRSSGEAIARTEALGASSGGALEAWKQSGVVERKAWISALTPRTREAHADYHGTEIEMDEDFEIGGCSGPGPGLLGCPEQDINCLCTLIPVVAERGALRPAKRQNGHRIVVHRIEPAPAIEDDRADALAAMTEMLRLTRQLRERATSPIVNIDTTPLAEALAGALSEAVADALRELPPAVVDTGPIADALRDLPAPQVNVESSAPIVQVALSTRKTKTVIKRDEYGRAEEAETVEKLELD